MLSKYAQPKLQEQSLLSKQVKLKIIMGRTDRYLKTPLPRHQWRTTQSVTPKWSSNANYNKGKTPQKRWLEDLHFKEDSTNDQYPSGQPLSVLISQKFLREKFIKTFKPLFFQSPLSPKPSKWVSSSRMTTRFLQENRLSSSQKY